MMTKKKNTHTGFWRQTQKFLVNVIEAPNSDYRQRLHTKMAHEVVTTKRRKRDKKQKKSKKKNKNRTEPQHHPQITMEAEYLADLKARAAKQERNLQRRQQHRSGVKSKQPFFLFTLLKLSAHAREQWGLRRTGAESLKSFLGRLEIGTLRCYWTKQHGVEGHCGKRWMVAASNGISLVLNWQKTTLITVLRDDKGRGYDYDAERYEQHLHSLPVDQLPWSELFPDRPHQ